MTDRLPGAPPPPLADPEELTLEEALARLRRRAAGLGDPDDASPARHDWTEGEIGRVIVLRREGYSHARICEELGCSGPALHALLIRIRRAVEPRRSHH